MNLFKDSFQTQRGQANNFDLAQQSYVHAMFKASYPSLEIRSVIPYILNLNRDYNGISQTSISFLHGYHVFTHKDVGAVPNSLLYITTLNQYGEEVIQSLNVSDSTSFQFYGTLVSYVSDNVNSVGYAFSGWKIDTEPNPSAGIPPISNNSIQIFYCTASAVNDDPLPVSNITLGVGCTFIDPLTSKIHFNPFLSLSPRQAFVNIIVPHFSHSFDAEYIQSELRPQGVPITQFLAEPPVILDASLGSAGWNVQCLVSFNNLTEGNTELRFIREEF